jgi:hypothetical protein
MEPFALPQSLLFALVTILNADTVRGVPASNLWEYSRIVKQSTKWIHISIVRKWHVPFVFELLPGIKHTYADIG